MEQVGHHAGQETDNQAQDRKKDIHRFKLSLDRNQ